MIRQIINIFMLLVLLFSACPPDYIHGFADHHDTESNYCETHGHKGVHFDSEQIHCDFLKHETPVYHSAYKVNAPENISFFIQRDYVIKVNQYSYSTLIKLSTRGPPASSSFCV